MDSVLKLKTNGNGNKHAISAQHLAATVRTLSDILRRTDSMMDVQDLAMERLAQSVSSAMSANCIYGNKREWTRFYC